MNCPCKNCDERHFKCHSECDKYKAWKSAREASLAGYKAKKESDGIYLDYFNELRRKHKRH